VHAALVRLWNRTTSSAGALVELLRVRDALAARRAAQGATGEDRLAFGTRGTLTSLLGPNGTAALGAVSTARIVETLRSVQAGMNPVEFREARLALYPPLVDVVTDVTEEAHVVAQLLSLID